MLLRKRVRTKTKERGKMRKPLSLKVGLNPPAGRDASVIDLLGLEVPHREYSWYSESQNNVH